MSAKMYIEQIHHLLHQIENNQMEVIDRVAEKIADSIGQGGVLHLFGSGHSHMIAEEAFHRAGGLACVNAMLEESLMETNTGRASMLERLPGYAKILLAGYDIRPGEVIIVISNSGINAVPVEIALECKEKGLHVVALTSMNHSQQMESRHSSGKRLFEVADEVLDNCVVLGDAGLSMAGMEQKIGPTSTIGGSVIIQCLITSVVEKLLQRNVVPPVFVSMNVGGGDDHNDRLVERYKDRIRYL
jgi:uncharacterized phosphosugar-binding protein